MRSADDQKASLLGSRVRVPEHVVYRDFPVETVVLNLRTDHYHGLNPTAGRMLAVLDRSSTVEEAATAIAKQFARPREDVENDMCDLCASLLERGLIEVEPEPSS